MTTETIEADSGSSFSPAEEAYFASGGEGTIPEEGSGAVAADTGAADAGAAADGAAAPAADAAAAATAKNDHVPLAKFMHEKNARKALETQVAELRGKFSIIEKLNAPAPGADAAAATAPTAEDDIFGAVKNQGETVEQLKKRLDDAEAATKVQNEQAAFVRDYQTDVADFTKTTPDFMAAYNFVLGSRAQELLAIGYTDPSDPTLTPDEKQAATKKLHEAIVADEFAIAQMARNAKKSAAQVLYGLAKQRGYKPAAAADAAAADTGKGAEILDRIERGQAANKSLTTPGGATGDAGMTGERLLAMPLDEFAAWTEKNPVAAKRLLGG